MSAIRRRQPPGGIGKRTAAGFLAILTGAFVLQLAFAGPALASGETLSIGDASIIEGNTGAHSMTFLVTLSRSNCLFFCPPVVVSWNTSDGTAHSPQDYVGTGGQLVWGQDQSGSQQIQIEVAGDTMFETNESFFVILSQPVNANISDGEGTGTIFNDDSQPSVSIGDASVAEGDSGTTEAAFTVSLGGNASGVPGSVDYATADGTATAPSDYQSASGTVNFPPGVTSQTVTVEVNGDTDPEPDENFFVNLTTPSNLAIGDGQGEGTILNDEQSISVSDASGAEGSQAGLPFVISLAGPASHPVSVDYATADGTAIDGQDYMGRSGTVTFAAGDTSKQVPVHVNDDNIYEGDETVYLNLSDPVGAPIGDGQGLGTIIDNDPVPALSIGDVSMDEGDSGQTSFVFPVQLTNPSSTAITVDYATSDGSATAGSDYQAAGDTLTIPAGDTTAQITVEVNGDLQAEPDEDYFVNLSNPGGATIADGQGRGVIRDDDSVDMAVSGFTASPDPVTAGHVLTYSIVVVNHGPHDAPGVEVTDTLSSRLIYQSSSASQGSCALAATTVTCSLGTMGPGNSASVQIQVIATTAGVVKDTVHVSSDKAERTPGDNSATVASVVKPDGPCTIEGTSGDDVLKGTSGDDVICGLGGNDTILPGLGNDTVSGGDGNDVIKDTYGNDVLYGEAGNDTLIGGPGNDSLYGGDGNDILKIKDKVSGNDSADGGDGADTCKADPGDIVLNCEM